MVEAYVEHGLSDVASFELFVRTLPAGRNFLMAAGFEQAVAFLESAGFDADEIAWLRAEGRFSDAAVAALAGFRFTGDVDALPEIASKAARLVLAARHRPLIDFGLRRAHEAEAALLAARASYLAGFAGTAAALAPMRFGIPARRLHGAFLRPGAWR